MIALTMNPFPNIVSPKLEKTEPAAVIPVAVDPEAVQTLSPIA
jgi:hypothetical protein